MCQTARPPMALASGDEINGWPFPLTRCMRREDDIQLPTLYSITHQSAVNIPYRNLLGINLPTYGTIATTFYTAT